MGWIIINIEAITICAILTLLASLITVIPSVFFGATLAYSARPSIRYGVALILLFIPFAMGSSVWAYSVTQLAAWSGIQASLLAGSTVDRSISLLSMSTARSIPLGVFFCATALQRYTSEIRPYLQTHRIGFFFFFVSAFNSIPKSIIMLIGLFGGAMMASEVALPVFLYRANPGTQPETMNIMLSRFFREIYQGVGPESLPQVATVGFVVSLALLLSAFLGTLLGKGVLDFIHTWFARSCSFRNKRFTFLLGLTCVGMLLCFIPGILGLVGVFAPLKDVITQSDNAIEKIGNYWGITIIGIIVGFSIVIVSILVAVRLRYGEKDWLRVIEQKPLPACVLILPTFIPILSVVVVLGKLTHGQMAGVSGYLAMFICHFGLHYTIVQFVCISLVATIPERHVSWQRAVKMNYRFSVVTDGFKRHRAVLIALVGLCTVLVATDGLVSRWFSYLVNSPDEALIAAVFGRLSSISEAIVIVRSVGIGAIVVCTVLVVAFIHELFNRP